MSAAVKTVPPEARRARLATFLFVLMQGVIFSSWASRIPEVKILLQLNDAQLGGLLLLLPFGQLFSMPFAGWLVSRVGSRRVVGYAAAGTALMLCFAGIAIQTGSLTALAVSLFLYGVGMNSTTISVNAQGVSVERRYERSIMAAFHGFWSIGGFLGGIITMLMVRWNVSLQTQYWLTFAAVAAGAAAFHSALLNQDLKPERRKTGLQFDRTVLILGFVTFGAMASEGTMFDWSGVFFESVVRCNERFYQLGYVTFMAAVTIGRFSADRLVGRIGAIRVIRLCGCLVACGMLIAVFFPWLLPATIGFGIVGLGTSAVVPLCYSLAGRSRTMAPGAAIAAVSTISFFGFLLAPPVIGFISHISNLRCAIAFMAIIGFSSSRLLSFLSEKKVSKEKLDT